MRDLVDKTYQIPYPSTGAETLLKRIEYIHSAENLDIIIPNFDAEILPFIKLQEKLRSMGINTFLPSEDQFEERQKINLEDFGKRHKLHVPAGSFVYSSSEIEAATAELGYPLVVKGKYYDAYIAHNLQQAIDYFNRIVSAWGGPVILQEFIKGTEFNVIGLGDGEGKTIAAVPIRKQYITDKGKAWGGISINDKKMLDLTHKFVSSTKWKGPFELELMKNNSSEFVVLEINPRIPAWVYLAVGVGQNIPELLARLALGEKPEPLDHYDIGKMFIRYSWDMIVDIDDFHQLTTYGEL
jgi:carbamoyl-phosphate synthase large subunit